MKRVSILVSLMVVCLPVMAMAAGDDLSGLMPEKAGDLVRVELVTGAAAQAEVDELHGKPLPAEASVIGRYTRFGAKGRPNEVWVSRVESEKEARRQTGLMVHMMYENPKSPFKNPSRLEHNGIAVYRFTGMGQVHLIWFKADLVYWVSSMADDEQSMMDVFCR